MEPTIHADECRQNIASLLSGLELVWFAEVSRACFAGGGCRIM
jgi:hypothetical protein